jgi:hypothetical protein
MNKIILLIILFIFLIIIISYRCLLKKRNIKEYYKKWQQIPNSISINGQHIITYPLIQHNNDKHYFNAKDELTNKQMNLILNKIIFQPKFNIIKSNFKEVKQYDYDYYDGFSGVKINNNKIKEIILEIIKDINYYSIILIDDNNYTFKYFILLQVQLIKILKSSINKKDSIIIELLADLYRLDKSSGFQIYFEIFIIDNLIYILNAYVYGNFNEDQIKINPNDNDNLLKIYKNFPFFKKNLNDKNGYLLDSNENKKKTVSIENRIDILNKVIYDNNKIKYDNSFKCFIGEGDDMHTCKSNKNIFNEKKQNGIWDKPCIYNEECPFYKSNKNYKNEFGGCINGTCQMPKGIDTIGHHFYNNVDKAICHNCKSINFNCCEEQKNRKKYPNLKSPDYAFSNDTKIF